jgi:TRAP transporter TAXI family solute receptor
MARIDLQRIPWRDALVVGVPLALVVIVAFWVTSRFIESSPPDRLVLSTGAPGGDYERFGERYRDYLAWHGVTLELRPSNGSVDNVRRLQRGEVDAAFVQGGTLEGSDEDAETRIVSLGGLYPEVVWVFVRDAAATLIELKGRRIAVGPEGSGLRPLALAMLRAGGVSHTDATLLPLAGADAAEALMRRDVDALFLIASPTSPVVMRLLAAPEVRPFAFAQRDALAHRMAALSRFDIARGLADLPKDLPRSDVKTVAVTANLLVHNDLHPALMYLLLDAASSIHGRHTLLADAGAYPNPRSQDVPLADEAERFYKSGKPFLKRYLPYWLANLADRLLVLLIPIVAVLLPVLRFLPALIEYRLHARIAKWYVRLGAIEDEMGDRLAPGRVPEFVAKLDAIETQVNDSNVPSGGADQLYALRAAIDLVRERLGHPAAKTIPHFRREGGA